MPYILQRPPVIRWFLRGSLALFILVASYIHYQSLTTPYSGLIVQQNAAGEWRVSLIQSDSIAERWKVEAGDRILTFDGRPDPKLFVIDDDSMVIGTRLIEVMDKQGHERTILIHPTWADKLEYGFALLMETFLIGVSWYAVRKMPESRLIRRFFLLNLLIAFAILTMFSDELVLSNILFPYCAVWLPYVILSFYLMFAFRTIHYRFRLLLVFYLTYTSALSVYVTYYIVRQITAPNWISNLLNVGFIGTLTLMAAITAIHWTRFDRIERNQLFLLFGSIFVSLMPYALLYALPYLLWTGYYVWVEYTLVGLVPISGTLTYLLVQRQMLDMRFYIPRLAIRSVYYGGTLTLFLLAAVSGSMLYAAGCCLLLWLLTYGYRYALRRLRRKEDRTTEWLEHQKLRMSLQLAEKRNIRDILKLFTDLLQDIIEVQGLTLVYFDDDDLPIVQSTGIYQSKWAIESTRVPLSNDWSGRDEYAQVLELSHELEGRKLGYLCLGPKTNRTLFSPEEQRLIGKFRNEAVQMLLNARQMFRLRQEYEQNKEQMDQHERQFRDFRTYSQMLLEAREAEKIRISYFLHDDLLQNLIFLSRDLEELQDTGRYVRERNATWLKCLYDSQRSIRSLSDHLYPHILDKGDLQEALNWLLRDLNHGEEMEVALQYEAPVAEPFPPFIKANLFRAVRELVVNVFKHAQASELHVRVWISTDRVCCSVADNGIGIPEGSTMRPSSGGGFRFGLLSVCDQMEHLGGTADIDSAGGQGTRVTLKLPLYKERLSFDG